VDVLEYCLRRPGFAVVRQVVVLVQWLVLLFPIIHLPGFSPLDPQANLFGTATLLVAYLIHTLRKVSLGRLGGALSLPISTLRPQQPTDLCYSPASLIRCLSSSNDPIPRKSRLKLYASSIMRMSSG
jgi:hypothetical protein